MANKAWCRHFTGVQNVTCGAGIEYQSVRQDHEPMARRFPCIHPDGANVCPHWQPYTQEEIDAFNAEIKAVVDGLNAFSDGRSKACPECGTPVTGAKIYEKFEPEVFSLYVKPCGCRLGLWSKVPVWITDVEVIPVQQDFGDEPEIDPPSNNPDVYDGTLL